MAKKRRGIVCPRCGSHAAIVPIVYGPLAPQQREQMAAGLLVMGGQAMYEDHRDPTHFCTACEVSFRPGSAILGSLEE